MDSNDEREALFSPEDNPTLNKDVSLPEAPSLDKVASFRIVALVASAGGLAALSTVLSGLPANFPAAVVIVQHLDRRHRSLLADILGRRTPLLVQQAGDGDEIEPGHVYIAPPDHHLLVNKDGRISLSHGELVRFLRPSGDMMLESLAASYTNRAIAVILTGTGADGSRGIEAIKKMGGTVIVQTAETAEFDGMPNAAIQTGVVDFILGLDQIAATLVSLVK